MTRVIPGPPVGLVGAIAGFVVGTALVLWAFLRQHSTASE